MSRSQGLALDSLVFALGVRCDTLWAIIAGLGCAMVACGVAFEVYRGFYRTSTNDDFNVSILTGIEWNEYLMCQPNHASSHL